MGTHEFVYEEAEKVLLLFGLSAKEVGEEGESLCTDVVEWIKGECLEDLEDGEEVFLEPILKVPTEKVRILDIWVEKRLIAKVSVEGFWRWIKTMSARSLEVQRERTVICEQDLRRPPTNQRHSVSL